MEDTTSPDASPADGDRRATMKRQKTAEPPPEEPLLDALVNRDEAAALALLTPDSTLDVNFRGTMQVTEALLCLLSPSNAWVEQD